MKSALFNFYFKLTLIVLCLPSLLAYPSKCKSCKNQYGPLQLEELKSLSVPSRLKPKGALLAPLLIPRVSGSANNTKVRNFIVDQLTQLNWHVELDTFEDSTPHGQIEFTNVVATKNPYADTKIIFAAHFDSKYFAKPENTFIGATDSAVPCAILLDMAITLNSYLEKSQISNNSTTIQLVFFDGEEAFQEWTNDDSIYGARHLAAKWVEDPSLDYYKKIPTLKNKIESIELFILLDLLGTAGTPIYSLNRPTHHYFEMLYDIENSIFKNQLQPNSLKQHQFMNQQFDSYVDDDHRPFLEKDVPVLHLIPVPFPKVWHRMTDNAKALSNPVIQHLALVFRVFAARLLCLEV